MKGRLAKNYLCPQKAHTLTHIIRIGTRGSDLALWQARHVQAALAALGYNSDLVILKTKGDKIQDLSFDKIEGKGFFTKELEDALLHGEIDMAVHSMKDLPTDTPDGLAITAVSYREDPADWLLMPRSKAATPHLSQLPQGAVVGTSSARRKAQLLHFRPDLQLADIRGNVPTRLQKLRNGDFDGIVLAAAGLTRLALDLSDLQVIRFNVREFVPAPAQGVLAYQTRRDDTEVRRALQRIHHPDVAAVTNIERKILQLMEGGCHMPLGVYCERDNSGNYHVWAAMAATWDAPLVSVQHSASTHFELAQVVADALRRKGS